MEMLRLQLLNTGKSQKSSAPQGETPAQPASSISLAVPWYRIQAARFHKAICKTKVSQYFQFYLSFFGMPSLSFRSSKLVILRFLALIK